MGIPQNLIILLKLLEYRRNERLSRAALEDMQLRKFRRLVAFVSRRSPYYADIIRERSIDIARCKPVDFPELTKSGLMANFDRIVSDRRITKHAISDFLAHSRDPSERFLGDIYVIHTSGSSGEVGMFVFSKADWARGLAKMAWRHDVPMPFRRRRVASFVAADGHYGGVSWGRTVRQGINRFFFDLLDLDINSPLPEVIDRLNAFQPDSLGGYVTGTKILAEQQRAGRLHIAPREIVLGGEVLTEHDRAEIAGTFCCPVTNVYGSTEHMVMARTLDGANMHLSEDDLMFELREDHTLVTNLFNFTLPLIRYRMNDVLAPAAHKASRWPYMEIDGVIGRLENTPRFLNRDGVEDFISPHTINEIFIPGVRRFQMQVLGKTSFRFAVCLNAALDARARADALAAADQRLREILQRKRMDNVAFALAIADDLPVDPKTRKFRLILDATQEDAGAASTCPVPSTRVTQ